MSITRFGSLLCLFVGSSFARNVAASGVRNLNDPSGTIHLDIQGAIDAASDGDVLFVDAGSYRPFVIDDRSITIFSRQTGSFGASSASIDGSVVVQNLAPERVVVLANLRIDAPESSGAGTNALEVLDCAGQVRLRSCRLTGGKGANFTNPAGPGGVGARIADSTEVCFRLCVLTGGIGGTKTCLQGSGAVGGPGLLAARSRVAAYDGQLIGGKGGGGIAGAPGGPGASIADGFLFASGANVKGGQGGGTCSGFGPGGTGGAGITSSGSVDVDTFACNVSGGAGGSGQSTGTSGPATVGPGITLQSGDARRVATPYLVSSPGSTSIDFSGAPGDLVFLPLSLRTGWHHSAWANGVWLIPFPALMPVVPLGIVPGSGSLTFSVDLSFATPAAGSNLVHAQGFALTPSGQAFLGSPADIVLVRRNAPPDCDGNGVNDALDLFEGTLADCNGSFVPDMCELLPGSATDCNGNGASDYCDIANGTSTDADQNAIPDECQPSRVWFVDAAAPSGGNGSAALPFQTIAQGIAPSLHGDVVIVRDGVYTGPQNRELEFFGRRIDVRSENGPANCIVDCQQAGRAFTLQGAEPPTAYVGGFTIQNGLADHGGGIRLLASNTTIVNCVFRGCVSSGPLGATYGGAIYSENGAPAIKFCTFVGNGARQGGAIAFGNQPGGSKLGVTHNRFLGNLAAAEGGALYYGGSPGSPPGAELVVESCLFAGNVAGNDVFAGSGGAIFMGMSWGDVRVSDSTFVENQAGSGGALDLFGCRQVLVANSIFWHDSGTLGPVARLHTSGSQPSATTMVWCDVEGGPNAIAVGPATSFTYGTGNVDLDPRFADPDGPDDVLATWEDNDYRLLLVSPCIDAGDNAVPPDFSDIDADGNVSEPVSLDLDLLPRFQDVPSVPDTGTGAPPVVDLGCYERQG